MNLNARINRKSISKVLLSAVLLSILPVITGSTPAANAASLSTTQAASACASAVSDSSTAKLDVRIDGNYCVLSFLSGTNTFMPPTGLGQIEYLAIGGGGGGGGGRGGGGGAGGFVTNFISTTSQISITVGNGGAGAVNSTNGSNGETTTISFSTTSINAIGGGGGGASFGAATNYPARSGASGGGAGIYASSLTANTDGGTPGGLGFAGQGNNGGSSGGKNPSDESDPSYSYKGTCTQNWDRIRNTAGGGGAGGKGIAGRGGAAPLMTPANLDSCQTPVAPNGGAGRSSNITGSSRLYAAGGGGSAGRFDKASENVNYYTAPAGAGGSGIGGAGSAVAGTNGGAGFPNTGSGGGGGGVSRTSDTDKGACATPSDLDESCDGGAGGSGIVIIRFQKYLENASECLTGVGNIGSTVFNYTTFAGDCVLTFKSNALNASATNAWTVPSGVTNARMLLVGGGGGGGNDVGGGGGGGQVLDTSTVAVTPGVTLNIYIGAGGGNGGGAANDSTPQATSGRNGESTTVSASNLLIKSLGGGGANGRYQRSTIFNQPDWSNTWTQGGHGYGKVSTLYNAVGGTSTNGGLASVGNDFDSNGNNAGGGGGSGGPGSNGVTNYNAGKGGDGGLGATTNITGFSQCFGGGGGGGTSYNANKQVFFPVGSGKCGGGSGLNANSSGSADATPNTGSGGGGGAEGSVNTFGGYGSSGIVIIRYTLKTSNQSSQNLNMACHAFASATTPSDALTAGYFGTPFTTDTGTTQFGFPTSTGSDVYQDWGTGGPEGCSTTNEYFTVYVSGYIRSPSTTQSSTVWFATLSDDGVRLNIDGRNLINNTNLRGFNVGYDTATASLTMEANSWHYIQMWMHENTGGAGLALYWQTNSSPDANAWSAVPRTNISRTVPRTLTFKTPTLDSSILSATVDTNTVVVYGGPNDSSTVKSTGGTFAFYESGTAISGCGSVVSVRGQATCDLGALPTPGVKKYYKIVFTPETSTASSDIQHNVYAPTLWTEIVTPGKLPNAKLRIGQYIAFTGVSSYPLNVYGDGSIYGDITRSLIDSGTANCSLDASKFFISASRVGSCTVSASAAGDATHFAETTTATIYWIQWSDAYATRVASTPTEIVLQHQTQITKYNFDTLTVTSYKNGSGTTVTEISAGSQLRIIGDGFNPSDNTTEVVFGNAEIVDMTYSTPALQVVSDGSGGYYLLVTVPSAATTDAVIVNSRKGTAAGPILTILSP